MHADREIKEERDHHRRSDNDRHHDREGTILTPKLKIHYNFVKTPENRAAFSHDVLNQYILLIPIQVGFFLVMGCFDTSLNTKTADSQ